jgi:hypothetical protein
MNKQEIRAKALEIAALIIGKTDKAMLPTKAPESSPAGQDELQAKTKEIFTAYQRLADLVATDISETR